MKAGQFWILTICSVIVSILMIKTVFLNRELDRQQRVLVDSQETASTASVYENAWKQLAVKIYQTGSQDPEMIGLLKSENVNIKSGTPPSAGNPSSSGATVPSTSSKPGAVPLPPTRPPGN